MNAYAKTKRTFKWRILYVAIVNYLIVLSILQDIPASRILMCLFQLFSNAAQMTTAERTNAASSWQEVVLKSTEEASHVHQTWVFQTQERANCFYSLMTRWIDQFRYIKIQPKTIDFNTRLLGINPTNSVVIPMSLVLRSIVLGWILIYRNWSIHRPIHAGFFLANQNVA